MHKNRLAVLFSVVLVSPALAQIRSWDFFDYPTDPPPQYLGGKTNPSQTDANPLRNQWNRGPASGAGVDVQIVGGSLSYPNLSTLGGNNMVSISGAVANSGIVDRLKPGGTGTISSGTLYYSLVLKVTALGTIGANQGMGGFVAGFNNSPVNTTNTGTNFAVARLQLVTSTATTFKVGIRGDVNSNGTPSCTSTTVFDPREFTAGPDSDAVFVVAAYTFVGGSPDPKINDVSSLWVNPDSSTFGVNPEPPTTLTVTGCDINQLEVQSFFLRNNSSAPMTTLMDQVRVGSDWASVTAFTPPPPFSCPTVKYDTDADLDVDLNDFGGFQVCFGLPAVAPDPCKCFDSDDNGTIDGADFVSFAACAITSGPNVPIAACP